MILAILACLCFDEIPKALIELERFRKSIVRADISWERTDYRGSFVPGVPKRYRAAYSENEMAFFANGTYDPEGSENGITAWTEDGEPVPDSRYANLATAQNRWAFKSDQMLATLWNSPPKPDEKESDIRVLGLMPLPDFTIDISKSLRGFDEEPARTYRESMEGGLHVVECKFPGADGKYVWYIDPEKNWSCVRAQAIVGGVVRSECVTQCQKTESGVWFPASVDYYAANMEPLVHIDVTSAKINTPDLPHRLTPDFIGLGSCMQVVVADTPGTTGQVMKYVADGKLATLDEYGELLRAGKTAVDPRMIKRDEERQRERVEFSTAEHARTERSKKLAETAATQPDDEWEHYTAAFIRKFGLDAEQSQKAMSALLICQQRRDRYLKSRESMLAEIGKELLTTRDSDKRKSIAARLQLLNRPVDEIFEKQLKPRLEKIPTRKQRQDAGAPDQPAAQRGP